MISSKILIYYLPHSSFITLTSDAVSTCYQSFLQVRFTDTLTVFIFILVSVYRTFLRFPHCLTIPAFNFFGCFHTVYNLFYIGDIQTPNANVIFYNRRWSYGIFGSISRSVAFAIPSYFCVYSLPPSHFFRIVLLPGKS